MRTLSNVHMQHFFSFLNDEKLSVRHLLNSILRRPLAVMQTLSNVQEVMVCRECMAFVGTTRMQLELLRGRGRMQCLEAALHAQAQGTATAEEEGFLSDIVPCAGNCGEVDCILNTQLEHVIKPGNEGFLSDIVPCAGNCGEVYCSAACAALHWRRSHRRLCVGGVSEAEADAHPLVRFRRHAVATNEIFLLVAEVVADQLGRLETNPEGGPEAALAPYAVFVREPWWEVAVDRAGAAATAALRVTLRRLVAESAALLSAALLPDAAAAAAAAALLEPEHLARTIGTFEQNNVGVRAASPLAAAFAAAAAAHGAGADALPAVRAALLALRAMIAAAAYDDGGSDGDDCDADDDDAEHEGEDCACAECDDDDTGGQGGFQGGEGGGMSDGGGEAAALSLVQILEEYDADALFTPLDGTALYSLICCMNHSCDPCCEIKYVGGAGAANPLRAAIVAKRDIAAGEELFQSYIDAAAPLSERAAALEEYGFACDCARCAADAAGGGAGAGAGDMEL
ncbi:hypothetical protein JKP88DRAFT_308474 [Tribonema minus]|uniref:SET domain-containing protein n=1 Tax=Tribonema minus TaxID=303371 RepID=A0A835Z6Z6_9STRA|nr:hypothetical protein JKP88DRAFT_308474 [Tribonema minus]